jgi:hypothetical protein
MSTAVMGLCWGLRNLTASQKMVLMSLADQANDQGVCWPGIDSMRIRTCLGERTIQRSIRELQQAGLIRIDDGGGRKNTNRYTVLCDAVADERFRQAEADMKAKEVPKNPDTEAPFQSEKGDTTAPIQPRNGDAMAPFVMRNPATVARKPRHSGTRTVIEPIPNTNTPIPPPGGVDGLPKALPAKPRQGSLDGLPEKPKRAAVGLATYLTECRKAGVKAIPADDPVYRYAESVGIPVEALELAWDVFKRRHMLSRKRQKAWPQAFRNSVESNWYRLWVIRGDGSFAITTQGQQAKRLKDSEEGDVLGDVGDDGQP